ncbi:MAG: hypothetical protein IH941_14245 [Acidobacteria bacterium]|nr:hypothetical protein [Acidobacteriota bacterium]
MKSSFGEFYEPTDDDLARAWQAGTFVLDANVLLNLYRYGDGSRDKLIDILSALRDQLWLPHQAGLEFHRNRLTVRLLIQHQFETIDERLKEAATIPEAQGSPSSLIPRHFGTVPCGSSVMSRGRVVAGGPPQ